MALTVSDFETQLNAIQTAIDAGDRAAAYKAYAKAEVILARLSLNKSVSDQSSTLQRRESLEKIKGALDSAFEAADAAADNGRRFVTTRTRHAY